MRPDCSAPTSEPEREAACLLIPRIILDYLEAYASILGHYEPNDPTRAGGANASDAGGAAARVFVCVPFRWGISRSVCWRFS